VKIALISYNAIPSRDASLKYERLGPLSLADHRRYCRRHGYTHIDTVPLPADRPACWAKIPAALRALEEFDWVVCADSDTLVATPARRLEEFMREGRDLVVESPVEPFRRAGFDEATAWARQPITTGVFLIRSCAWSRRFLTAAYRRTEFVRREAVWNGIGEQEAMIAEWRDDPEVHGHVGHATGLQTHPCFFRPGNLFLHLYGNYASHRLPAQTCAEVLGRWEHAVESGAPLPEDVARFHWCCIQNQKNGSGLDRGGPERFFYSEEEIRGEFSWAPPRWPGGENSHV